MKRFTYFRGVLDGFRSSVSNQPKSETEIEEALRSEDFHVSKTVRHGFPYQPTAIAYDPVQHLLAIGTKSGSLRILGQPGVDLHCQHDGDIAVLQILFLVNEGAMVTVCSDDSMHLWNFRQKIPEIVHTLKFQRERITHCHLPFQSKWLYVGTERGNVHVVNIESFSLSGYVINWNKAIELSRKTHPGPVVHISDNPVDSNKLLVGFESGTIVLWDLKNKTAEYRYSAPEALRSISWHHEGKQFMSSHTDGSLATWNLRMPQKPTSIMTPHAKIGKDGKPDPCKPITRVEWKSVKNSEPLVIFSGGMSYDRAGRTPCITVMTGKTTTVLEMEHNVVDFVVLCETPWSNDFQEPYAIVVLLQNDLVVIDLTSEGYPCFENPYPMDIHASPITACQYYADCPTDLIPAFYSVGSKQKRSGFSEKNWPIKGGVWGTATCSYPELVITGHADGSVKFWDASAVNLQVLYTVKTAKIFEKLKNKSLEEEDQFAIYHIFFCPESRLMCLGGATHVMLFKFSKQEVTLEVPSLEVSIVYEVYDDIDSPELDYPKPSLSVVGQHQQSGSVGSYSSNTSDSTKPEATTVLKVRMGARRWSMGYQPDLVCLLTWLDNEHPGNITNISLNSTYGLMAFGNESGLAIIDIVQKSCLLNLGTPDLYGSMDPYQRAPRSPRGKKPQQFDANNPSLGSDEGTRSPTSDQSSSLPSTTLAPQPHQKRPSKGDLYAIKEVGTLDENRETKSKGKPSNSTDKSQEGLISTTSDQGLLLSDQPTICVQAPSEDQLSSPIKSEVKGVISLPLEPLTKEKRKKSLEEKSQAVRFEAEIEEREIYETTKSVVSETLSDPIKKGNKDDAGSHHHRRLSIQNLKQKFKYKQSKHKEHESAESVKSEKEEPFLHFSDHPKVHVQPQSPMRSLSDDQLLSPTKTKTKRAISLPLVQTKEKRKKSLEEELQGNWNLDAKIEKKDLIGMQEKVVSENLSDPVKVEKKDKDGVHHHQKLSVKNIKQKLKHKDHKYKDQESAESVKAKEEDSSDFPLELQNREAISIAEQLDHRASDELECRAFEELQRKAVTESEHKSSEESEHNSDNENRIYYEEGERSLMGDPTAGFSKPRRKSIFERMGIKVKELVKGKEEEEEVEEKSVWNRKISFLDLTGESNNSIKPVRLNMQLRDMMTFGNTDKNDSTFSRSRSSSMSSLENVSKEAIQCLVFADSFSRKNDNFTCPCLWVGTSLGSVLVILLNLPQQGDQRLTQPVIVSPSGTIFRLKGPIQNISFLDCNGTLIPKLSDQWRDQARDNREEKTLKQTPRQVSQAAPKPRISPSSSTEMSDRQFAIICSEKQARVVALPSQTCPYKVRISEHSFVVRADIVSFKGDCVCLACYIANGHIMMYSLPSLKLLLDVDFLPLTDLRIARTFCFSNHGHALYMCSPTEMQKLTYSAALCDNLGEMLGDLFLAVVTPEAPKQNFFKNLFSGGSNTLDREELFGEASGKGPRGLATKLPGTGMQQLQGASGTIAGEVAKTRQALSERGEKLSGVEERTAQMASEAESYAHASHQLMLKYKDKKWYQF
ncbi:hypothetical protein ACJMK2_028851 [Sinanodonta woodiana]|uniref:Syntaxin-binding protein 5-like n=1 Tax=Sinanodonta woodiana TaxID=1069815 RepID=A0ABD3X8S4_SINWO